MAQHATISRKRNAPVATAEAPSAAPTSEAPIAGGSSPTLGHDIGRIAVRSMQAKMTVSQPGDAHEQEAEQVADHVMRMGDSEAAGPAARLGNSETVHRAEASEEEDDKVKLSRSADPVVARDASPEDDDKEKLSRSPLESATAPLVSRSGEGGGGGSDVSGVVSRGLAGGGQPLDARTRAFMEPRFGHDFSGVRVHTDAAASQSAEAVAARAYTVGGDIAFRAGEYSPGGSGGQHLLAHELTHVVQQGAAGGLGAQRSPVAEGLGAQRSPMAGGASGSLVQRDPAPAPASATPTAAPGPAAATPNQAAPTNAKTPVPTASVNEMVQAIIVQYQGIFEKQMLAVQQLEADFAKADEPSTTDFIIQSGVQFALGAALGALATSIATWAGNATGDVILKRALKSAEPAGMLTAEDIATYDTAEARATAMSLATKGGDWLGGKAKEQVPKVYASISSSLKETQKFLEAHKLSLINLKVEAQKDLLLNVAPALEAMKPTDGAVAAQRLLSGLEQTDQSAVQVQYLQSVAQWAQIQGGGPNMDLTAAAKGVLRVQYYADNPMGDLKIKSAEITDMDQDVLKRLHDTDALKNMKISDFPIAKAFMGDGGLDGPPFIIVPSGGGAPEMRTYVPWTTKRAPKYGIDVTQADSSAVNLIVMSFMMSELGSLPLSSLGKIAG